MYFVFLLASILGLVASTEAYNCNISALVIPLTNATSSTNGIPFTSRGIGVSLGRQFEGLPLTFSYNNTSIRNSRDCDISNVTATISRCRRESGGVFSITDSTTFASVSNWRDWAVPTVDGPKDSASIIYGYDDLTISNQTVHKFPVQVWSNTSTSETSHFGLGAKSSVISTLLAANTIPSPEIGLFHGSQSLSKPTAGELIIGGYNSSLVSGPFTSYHIGPRYTTDIPCPLQIYIKDILIYDSKASGRSLIPDPAARLAACIDPLSYNIALSDSLFDSLNILTQHDPSLPDSQYLSTDKLASLSILLENDYPTIIPGEELISYTRSSNDQGQYAVTNTSLYTTILTRSRAPYVILGGAFLSQNYLRVDYAAGTFSLAPAVVGGLTGNNGSSLVSTCVPSASPPAEVVVKKKKGLGKGGIAGAVVGSIIGVIVLAVVVWKLWPRKNIELAPMHAAPHAAQWNRYPEINTAQG